MVSPTSMLSFYQRSRFEDKFFKPLSKEAMKQKYYLKISCEHKYNSQKDILFYMEIQSLLGLNLTKALIILLKWVV